MVQGKMTIYNKLVRDKIPAIINSSGQKAITAVLDNNEYRKKLDEKLLEEVNEYLMSGSVEELADIAEVLYTILDLKGVSTPAFERVMRDKTEEKGAFRKRLLLIRVD